MKKGLLIVGIISALMIGLIGYETITTTSKATDTFTEDGYILAIEEGDSEEGVVSSQYHFSSGTSYKENYDNTKVSFKSTDGEKVSTKKTSFVHFQNGNMSALSVSMLMDADDLDSNTIYSLEANTELQKTGTGYALNNAGELISLENIIWKISSTQYMVVSDEIELVVNEKESLTFEDYVEILYDEGIVYLINDAGSYPTISSDAYLELENGVRVYLGSKNVSDGEEYKMNLTSILVTSEDGSEMIPDEDYNIEVIDNPYVVVNVSDGEDGTGGEDGGEGQGGTQGNGGKAGSQGSQGSSGTSAENSNISYVADTMPIFEATLTPKSYGVESTLKVNSNNTSISQTKVIIKNSATGAEVFSQDITDDLNEASAFAGPSVDCLSQNTEYTYLIQSTYMTATGTEEVTQIVLSKIFYTSSLGVTLQHKYSTDSSIVVDVVRTTLDGADKIRIKVYDENMTYIGYAVPVDTTDLNFVEDGDDAGKFDIPDTVNVGDTISVKMDELSSDSIYYFQIEVLHLASDLQIIPSGAFPYEKYLTLKRSPLLSKPSAVLNESLNSFIISDVVNDYDNGITGYRYEIYLTDGYYEGAEPVVTINKDTLTNYSLLIDGNTIKRETYYYAQIVAIFNDNYTTTEYRSTLSDPMYAGESTWPTITMAPADVQVTASTVEGKIVISDPNNTIQDYGDSVWSLKIVISPTTPIDDGDVNRQTQTKIFDPAEFTKSRTPNGSVYQIDFAFKALKSNQPYTITIYAHSMTVNDLTIGGDTPVIVGTATLTTSDYDELYIRSEEADPSGYYFHIHAILSPESETKENLKETETSTVDGLENLGDFSGRSMTYIAMELYAQNPNGTGPDLTTKLGTTYSYCDQLSEYNPEDYDLDTIDWENYATIYDFNSSLYRKAYLRKQQDTLSEYALDLTDKSFGLEVADFANYRYEYVYLKVSKIYDYTYGTGGDNYPIYGDLCNTIDCGTSQDYIADDEYNEDCWIEIELNVTEPSIPATPYFYDTSLTKGAAEKMEDGVVTYYSDPGHYNNVFNSVDYNNNISTLLTNMTADSTWTDIASYTDVGIQITGPGSLAKNSSKVLYTIYVYDEGTDTYVEANNSGWLTVDSDVTLPTYTYFLNIQDKDTGITARRGDKIKVKMELELSRVLDDDGNYMIWPTNSSDANVRSQEIATVFEMKKQTPTMRMIPYKADASSSNGDDQYYFIYDDPDDALKRNSSDEIEFFNSGSDTPLTTSCETLNNMNLVTVTGTVPHDEKMVVKYKRVNSYTSYTEYTLVSEENIYGDHSITIVNDSERPFTVDTSGKANVQFVVYYVAQTYKDLVAADVTFTKEGFETIAIKDCDIAYNTIPQTYNGETYYECTISVPLQKVLALAGYGDIDATVTCYYDSGKYGLYYTDGAHALEYQNKDDMGSIYMTTMPGQSKYLYEGYDFDYDTDIDFSDSSITIDEYDQTYNNEGITVVPKKMEGATITAYDIALNAVDPGISCNVSTGYSVARADIYVSPNHGLDKSKGLRIEYRKMGSDDAFEKVYLSMTNNEYHWNQLIRNLDSNTSYEYKIYGYKRIDGVYTDSELYSGNFKTKVEIPYTFTDFEFEAYSDSRDSKYAIANVTITDVLYADLKDSVSGITFKLYEGDPDDPESTLISTQSVSGTDLAELLPEACKTSGSTTTGTVNYTVQFGWEPAAEHEMNGEKVYYMTAALNYVGGVQDTDKELYKQADAWENGTDLSFAITGSTGTTKMTGNNYNFWAKFVVSGNDYKRLIAETVAGKTRYVAELHKVVGDEDTVVEYSNNMRYAYDVINTDGAIEANTITYDFLEPNTEYYLKIYAAVDNANTDILALATTDNMDEAYSASSYHVKTPESSDIKVTSMSMIPSLQQIIVDGENLQYTKKIYYVLTDKTTKTQQTVTLVENGSGSSNITANFTVDSSSGTENKYILNVPAMADETHNYSIKAYFYKTADQSTASCTFTGTYTYTAPSTGSKLASFFKTKLFSFLGNND